MNRNVEFGSSGAFAGFYVSSQCPVSWAQHPGPLTLSEILAIKEWLAEYITDVVDAYLGEKNT